jgi:hypothetical protein
VVLPEPPPQVAAATWAMARYCPGAMSKEPQQRVASEIWAMTRYLLRAVLKERHERFWSEVGDGNEVVDRMLIQRLPWLRVVSRIRRTER